MSIDQLIRSKQRSRYAIIIRHYMRIHYGLHPDNRDTSMMDEFIDLGFVFTLDEHLCPK